MSDFERLRECFDSMGVPYTIWAPAVPTDYPAKTLECGRNTSFDFNSRGEFLGLTVATQDDAEHLSRQDGVIPAPDVVVEANAARAAIAHAIRAQAAQHAREENAAREHARLASLHAQYPLPAPGHAWEVIQARAAQRVTDGAASTVEQATLQLLDEDPPLFEMVLLEEKLRVGNRLDALRADSKGGWY